MRDLLYLQNTSTASVVHANSASVLPLVPSCTIPASEMITGRRVRLRSWGIYSTAAIPPTIKFASRIESSEVNTLSGYTLPASASNWSFLYESDHIMDSTVTGGTSLSTARLTIQILSTGESATILIPRATSFNTNGIARAFDAIMQWGTASTSNTMTIQSSSIETF